MRRLGSIVAVCLLAACDAAAPVAATPTEIRAAHSYDPTEHRGTRWAETRPPDVPTARAVYCPDVEPVTEGTTRVELWHAYFYDDGESFYENIVIVHRDIPTTDGIAAATLREWFKGETASERKRGIFSQVPPGTQLLGLDIDDGFAVVDLNQAFEYNGLGTVYEGWLLTQLAGTLYQFPTIERVKLRIEGVERTSFGGHGLHIGKDGLNRPLRRFVDLADDLCLS